MPRLIQASILYGELPDAVDKYTPHSRLRPNRTFRVPEAATIGTPAGETRRNLHPGNEFSLRIRSAAASNQSQISKIITAPTTAPMRPAPSSAELLPNFGDGLKDQAAAWA